jgi:hypothetical protein
VAPTSDPMREVFKEITGKLNLSVLRKANSLINETEIKGE